jgi:hypothetical protein
VAVPPHLVSASQAHKLQLFKVDIPAVDQSKIPAEPDLPSMRMRPVFKLSKYYSTAPPEKTIRVLVRLPDSGK